MRSILGAVAGLLVGTLGALAYSHYLGEGQTNQAQADLDAANANLAKATKDNQELKSEVDALSAQVKQLIASNDELKKSQGDAGAASATPQADPSPSINPMMIEGLIGGMMRGGGFQNAQKLLVLKARLHLTPDQETAIKAAMDADARQRRDQMRQMFGGGQGGQAAPVAPGPSQLDQTLSKVLTLDQQTAYQQVQADLKTSQAETAATLQVNQVAPLLQLSETQKDQVYTALYQVQSTAPDPASLIGNPNAASIIAAQTQATNDAMAKVLTPDQMALYQQQALTMPTGGFGQRRNRGGDGANGGGGGAAATAAPASTPASATPVPATTN